MSRRVYIVRHAKSDWDNLLLADIERPLNAKGNADAPLMGKFLENKYGVPQKVYVSSSVRTQETFAHFKNNWEAKEYDVEVLPMLYHADIDTIFDVIADSDDDFESIMVIAHNPGIELLANELSDTEITEVPTCTVLVIDVDADSWDTCHLGQFTLKAIHTPKSI